MASSISDKFGQAVGKASDAFTDDNGAEDEDIAAQMGAKYMLQVTAGPTYNISTHNPVFVNTDIPTVIENEYLTAKVKVRVRNYDGLPKGSETTSVYFENEVHKNDQYSISFSFIPKEDIDGENSVWGVDFPHPVRDRLPPAAVVSTGWRIFKTFIDPSVSHDVYADEPWLLGPTLTTWFIIRIGEKIDPAKHRDHLHPAESNPVQEGADGESAAAIRQKFGMPDNSAKRRKHFVDEKNRKGFVFEKDRLYTIDFHGPYIDFGKFALKMPGFTLSVAKYINDKTHNLRWVFKDTVAKKLYLVVMFTLLHGADVDKALAAEEKFKRQVKEIREGGSPSNNAAD